MLMSPPNDTSTLIVISSEHDNGITGALGSGPASLTLLVRVLSRMTGLLFSHVLVVVQMKITMFLF